MLLALQRPVQRSTLCLAIILVFTSTMVREGDCQCAESECAETMAADHYRSACDAIRPRWRAWGRVLAMDRITDDPLTLMVSPTNTAEQLNVRDFNFDWNLGFDASLMRVAWDDTAMEVRYLDLGRLNGANQVTVSNSQVRINSDPPVFVSNVQSIDTVFSTELFSFEANYHYPLYEYFSFLVGFRYVSFDDEIDSRLDANPQAVRMIVSTENQMYGGQIGLVSQPFQPTRACVWLNGFIKLGVYGNDAEHRSLLDTGVSRLGIHEPADDSSFLGEFGATVTIPICDRIKVTGGYRLLWLESIAIASRQIAVSDYLNGLGSTDHGNALFHGATLGVELAF